MQPMFECIVDRDETARPLYPVRPADLARLLDRFPLRKSAGCATWALPRNPARWCSCPDRTASPARSAVWATTSPFAFGHLARFAAGRHDLAAATRRLRSRSGDARLLPRRLPLYRIETSRPRARPTCGCRRSKRPRACRRPHAIYMARDLINTPANLLGPVELADAAIALGRRFGAETTSGRGRRARPRLSDRRRGRCRFGPPSARGNLPLAGQRGA